ncbi:MAG: FAD-binding oxidoreductase [Alphaproteobacteria bacterium]|nr:FAD-binding oxidoreductase [Alphaproteobacteria bacterium]
MTTYDVVIIGGGIVGASTAYYLRKNGFKGSVVIIEKDMSFRQSCTALSWGGIRRQFSTPENIQMSAFGMALIANLKHEFGAEADIGFKPNGYVVLASDASVSALEENVKLQNALGAGTQLVDAAELGARFPYMNLDGIAAAGIGGKGEGWFDPYQFMNIIRKAAMTQNVDVIKDEVVGISAADTINRVTLATGATLTAGTIVNAAGTGAGAVAAMIGFSLPVSAAKRYACVVDCPAASELLHAAPMMFDVTGLHYRHEGRNFLLGCTPSAEEEPPVQDWEMDYSWFEEKIWPLAAARIPAFEAIKLVSHWVGHYDYNWFDQNGIIGRHPHLPNFYFGNGFSGHGIQHGPATGNALAELICFGEYRTIDLTALGPSRIAAKAPLFEKNIY